MSTLGDNYNTALARLTEAQDAARWLADHGYSVDVDSGNATVREKSGLAVQQPQRQAEYNTVRAALWAVRGSDFAPEVRAVVTKALADAKATPA